jgi:hypothetical protein
MTELDISNNVMNADGCKMICKALQGNNILTQLSMAKNDMTWGGSAYDDMSAVIALCKILPNMGASSGYFDQFQQLFVQHISRELSDQQYAEALKKLSAVHINENGALIKLDISNNRIGAEQERGLQRICEAGGIELAK